MSGEVRVKDTKRVTPIAVDESPRKSMWITEAVEWFEGPPADLTPMPRYILDALHRFDAEAYPLFVRRVYKTPEGKLVIRTHNALAYQKWTPSKEKEPINVLRGSFPGPLRSFNGPLYEDRVMEWFPPWFDRRDRPGVFQPWDDIRLTELKHQHWQLYGRAYGVEKTEAYLQSLFKARAQREQEIVSVGMDRLNDAAGPFDSPFVGYTGKEFNAA